MSGRLEKPDHITLEQMRLIGIEDAVAKNESVSFEEAKRRSEAALTALSTLRAIEPIYDDEGIATGKTRSIEPRWMSLYQELRDIGYDWRVAVYIAWAAQPKKYRWPETQQELATRCMGLTSDRAIATWRKNNHTIDEAIAMLQGHIVFDALPDAMQAMVDVATTGNYKGHQDRRLLFEMAGLYVPSSRLTAEMVKKLGKGNGDEREMSSEELREIAAMAGGELKRRKEEEGEQ